MNSINSTNPYTGIDKSWQILKESDPEKIAENTLTEYDSKKNIFKIKYINTNYAIDLNAQTISTQVPGIVKGFDINLSLLIYMTTMDTEMPTDKFISTSENPTINQFFAKNHEIPTPKLSKAFDTNKEEFKKKCIHLGAETYPFGDIGLKFKVLPKADIAIIYWKGDDEFPSNTTFLFEKMLINKMPPDALWTLSKTVIKTLTETGK